MYVDGDHELVGADAVPETEINAFVVAADHPAEEHIQPFAARISGGRGNVLAGTFGEE